LRVMFGLRGKFAATASGIANAGVQSRLWRAAFTPVGF
jgi:hypothetical protein